LKRIIALLCSLGIIGALLLPGQPINPVETFHAVAAACSGESCIGLNPEGNCDGDAETVASMAVPSLTGGFAGQLDLRYSEYCKSNWGRYTPYTRNFIGIPLGVPVSSYGRVTVWNPGAPSQPGVHGFKEASSVGSEWTKMVDGTMTACVGVELFMYTYDKDSMRQGDLESEGWTWGPCV